MQPARAVALAAVSSGLTKNIGDAVEDVERALAALDRLGVRDTSTARLEYPVAGAAGSNLVAGYVDLVAKVAGSTLVIDFKTDAAPDVGVPLPYINQVLGYARVITESLGTQVRAGLLFTSDGSVHWL